MVTYYLQLQGTLLGLDRWYKLSRLASFTSPWHDPVQGEGRLHRLTSSWCYAAAGGAIALPWDRPRVASRIQSQLRVRVCSVCCHVASFGEATITHSSDTEIVKSPRLSRWMSHLSMRWWGYCVAHCRPCISMQKNRDSMSITSQNRNLHTAYSIQHTA